MIALPAVMGSPYVYHDDKNDVNAKSIIILEIMPQ
jgi:hypothetical protein